MFWKCLKNFDDHSVRQSTRAAAAQLPVNEQEKLQYTVYKA